MKFTVIYVPVHRTSRRRTGKARTSVVDTATDPWYDGTIDPRTVEVRFEHRFEVVGDNSVKVIDIRERR